MQHMNRYDLQCNIKRGMTQQYY